MKLLRILLVLETHFNFWRESGTVTVMVTEEWRPFDQYLYVGESTDCYHLCISVAELAVVASMNVVASLVVEL